MGTDSVSEEDQRMPILRQIRENFKWNNFWYAFFFGLLPTVWDIYSDYQL